MSHAIRRASGFGAAFGGHFPGTRRLDLALGGGKNLRFREPHGLKSAFGT
jgi:hypothetical protein